jgi:hypothetical protein
MGMVVRGKWVLDNPNYVEPPPGYIPRSTLSTNYSWFAFGETRFVSRMSRARESQFEPTIKRISRDLEVLVKLADQVRYQRHEWQQMAVCIDVGIETGRWSSENVALAMNGDIGKTDELFATLPKEKK